MRTRKGKRSEAFWPSTVMRKWLNIKPKVHEFSADEVDAESEDDDLTNSRVDPSCEILGRAEALPTRASVIGTQTKAHLSKLRRRKSETLRFHYISKKDVRVMIGTWNVAGRVPDVDLELDDWLCTKEPADIYILGFQEVVPLNAANILGAENSRPIPKWEAIIRRTLNKSIEAQKLCKSYSALPSAFSRSSTPNDALMGEKGAPEVAAGSTGTAQVAATERKRQNELFDFGMEFQWDKINGTDGATALDWPEHSFDMSSQTLSFGSNLRRTLSSSPRVGFDCLADDQVCNSHDAELNAGLKRVHHSLGNLGMLWSKQQEASDVLSSLNDVSNRILGEDDSSLGNAMEKSEVEDNGEHSEPRARYVRIVSKQMVGIYISVWVCRRLRSHINNLKVYPVGVGLMGYMGNKGSVSVSMSLFQTWFCFVCSHLTSGHKEGDQERRNSDVYDILQRTRFSSILDADQPLTIPSHDRIFWFGDLNYRLNISDAEARTLVAMKQWDELMNFDQLSNELRNGRIFDGWKEGLINFPPTYKYETNSNRYVGENAREGEKKRTPAWCDRILWLGKGIKQLAYWRSEQNISDHRPVSSIFSVEVEVFDQRKLERVLNFSSAGLQSGDYRPKKNR